MQFHIDGRFQADIWCENASWTVQRAEQPTHGAARAPLPSSGLEDDDIGSYLEALFDDVIDNDT